ncbi:MAG: acyltransferase, partial [Pseudolabrys sp.]|nr:acyltransferase [Pseudolabrys sp.]
EVQHLAYWTIFGRIDQFVFGMLFAIIPMPRQTLRVVAAVSFCIFLIIWTMFDCMGGFNMNDGASPSALWIAIPAIEGLAWASMIALYDGAHFKMPPVLDRALAKIGEWSYSIYLLHFFPIVAMRHLFWDRIGSADNFFVALLVANLAFLAFLPVAAASYIYFEKIFLAYRRPYLRALIGETVAALR